MTEQIARSWLGGRELTGFALPSGRLARPMGWLMARNLPEMRDVLGLVAAQPGQHVVEIGYGPGALVTALLRTGATVTGVDPSAAMLAMARRRNAAAVGDGRADLRAGTAEHTGLPDACADVVVSLNNVPMWSDLGAGLRELHRIVRPGGRLVVAWHGGERPTWFARRLTLPTEVLHEILAELRETFGAGERRTLPRVEAFIATRRESR